MKAKNKNAIYMVATMIGLSFGAATAATAPNQNIGKVANASNIGIGNNIAEHWRAAAVLPTSSFLNNTAANVANTVALEVNDTGQHALVNENSSALRPNNTAYAIAANQDTGSSGAHPLSVGNANGNLGSANNALVLGSSDLSVQKLE